MENRLIRDIRKKKKGQDEMVGFGLIIMVVAVILLVFVASTLNRTRNQTKEIDDYETNAFVQSTLQYTTACAVDEKYIDIKDLIFECANEGVCKNNNREACEILDLTIREILKESWRTGGDNVTKGYELVILANSDPIIRITQGSPESKNYRANPPTEFTKAGNKIEFYFTAYY